MSGRISVDAAAFDAGARKLRSAKGGLAGVQGRLNDGLAAGAPPAVAGQVRAAVAAAKSAASGVQGRLDWRATELTRRAALTRVAAGDGDSQDFKIMLGWGASKFEVGIKDYAGGVDEGLKRWASFWETHYIRRLRGVKRDFPGMSMRRAFLLGKTEFVGLKRNIKKNAPTVEKLRFASKTIRWLSVAADALETVTAKGSVKQNEALGGAVGGTAGALAGAELGAAIGVVGGPIGVAVGAGVGATIGAIAGSGLGKWAGRRIGNTAVGRGIGKGIDATKGAVKSVGGGVKKVWKKLF